jgi:hypothetical protein
MKKILTLLLLFSLNFFALGQNRPTAKSFCDSIIDDRFNCKIFPIMPVFPGGPEKLSQFIYDNVKIVNEQDTLNKRIYAYLLINEHGRVSDACVFSNRTNICSTPLGIEVLRVVMMMPVWEPAEIYSKPTTVRFGFQIK